MYSHFRFSSFKLILLRYNGYHFCNSSRAESISSVSCNEKDKQALVTLKRGLTDHGHVLSSWSDHKDCCIRDRVFCDNKTGRVTELHLNYPMRLGGEISGSLLQLEHLNYLNLSYNDFNCSVGSKGKEMEYKENLKFVRLIDLSSNNLSGSILAEISDLSKLRFLNLSRNHLMGKIPEKIGSMKELESVDLSRNHLSGEIPPSMSNMTFLSLLDLSFNNLSGRIPSSTQLQSFDAHSYIGNPQLCGDPLPKSCTIEEQSLNRSPIGSVEDDSKNSSFCIGMGFGFATGFWAICGALFFNRTWRHAYFRFADEIKDWIYVTTMIKMNLLEKLRVCLSK